MPDYRTHTQVSARGDVDFHKRPDPLRKNRWKWVVAFGILGLWPLVWQVAGNNDQTIYWSHTVSTSHQIVQHDCKKCHREWCQTFRMNFMDPTEIRVIEANTCQTCHWEDTRDHNALMISDEAKGCFHCHAEHRHKPDLNQVANVFCVDCHRDLRIEEQQGIAASESFVTGIHSFADHPEFALRRNPNDVKPAGDKNHHQVHRWANPPPNTETKSGTSWAWTDKANFRFNHEKHLLAAGVGIPDNHPDNLERLKEGKPIRPTKLLNCADCHQVDDKGEYFKPIHYETHCIQCHELSVDEKLSEVDERTTLVRALPHEAPEIIRGTLRDRLTTFIANHPERLTQQKKPQETPLPFKDPKAAGSIFQNQADWVEAELGKLEKIVQGEKQEQGTKYPALKNACIKCHVIQSNNNAKGVNWDVLKPNIPDRWLPHSRFRHDRHDMLECFACHHVRPPEDPELSDPRKDPGSIYFSKSAKDILMPSIATCRACHGSRVETPLPWRVKARTDCIECHAYHHTLNIQPNTRGRWDLEDGISDVKNRLWRIRKVPVSREELLKGLPTQ